MFDRWFNLPAHKYLHLTALMIIAVGVSLSNVLMSIGTIWIASNALIQADFKEYWERIKKNQFLWFLILFILLNLLSILWSENKEVAFRDIRTKLPLFTIPLIVGIQKPLPQKELKYILLGFIGVVTLTSLINFFTYSPSGEIREMSRFISHVRFSISLNIALGACFYLIIEKHFKWFYILPLIPWLAYYLFKSQILTGYILAAVLFLMLAKYVSKALGIYKYRIVILATLFSAIFYFITQSAGRITEYLNQEPVSFQSLDLYSANGNPYYHDTLNALTENGNFVWIYVQHDEMRKEWNKRSDFDYDGEDRLGQPLYGTLMRYLTSKNLRKDSAGVAVLSESDITNVQNGQTSITSNAGVQGRFDALLLELFNYTKDANPNGSSLLQRKEHLKMAFELVSVHWLFGTGIGDVEMAFQEAYVLHDSRLDHKNRWISHNQYLTTWIGLGIIGFIIFLRLIFYPLFQNKNKGDFLFRMIGVFLVIAALFQDIIETQAGVTIFSFFLAIAVFAESSATEKESI